ncbi:MAG: ABC transporter permease [Anaerolineales bacterium]|jgi:ABC-2 type transport system permease protein
MTALYIALKDLKRQFRSPFAVAFMFLLPLATAGLIGLAFSGLVSEEGGFEIARTWVIVANEDEPLAAAGGFSVGQTLVDFLQSEDLSSLIEIMMTDQADEASTAVQQGTAGVAVIIPHGLTASVFISHQPATIRIESDPALTLGPDIVSAIISDFVDGFSASLIAGDVVSQQLAEEGINLDQEQVQAVIQTFAQWVQDNQTAGSGASGSVINTEAVQSNSGRQSSPFEDMISNIVVGMMIFYAFFTGASGAQSIIQEDEQGTLSRMFSTPTSPATILGGKFVNIFVMVLVQIVVTMLAARLIFNIRWGNVLPLLAAIVALNVVATGFGLLVISPLKSTRQAGAIMGIVLTMTGMAGGLMTTGFPNMPEGFNTLTRLMPQGWALETFRTAMTASHLSTVLTPALITIAIGAVCFMIGAQLFRRRFI